jgi:hypothetical protein
LLKRLLKYGGWKTVLNGKEIIETEKSKKANKGKTKQAKAGVLLCLF